MPDDDLRPMTPAQPQPRHASALRPRRSWPGTVLAVLLAAQLGPVGAAPTSADELGGNGVPAPSKSAPAATGAPAGASPQLPAAGGSDQARTMELLLQLQDKPSAFAKDRAGAASTPSLRRALAATAAEDAAAAASSPDLLGSMKKSMMGDSPAAADMRTDVGSGVVQAAPGGAAPSTRPAGDGAEPRKSVPSNPVVRYIRENRLLVIGLSLGLLAAVWMAAGFSMRRRR